MGLVFWDRLHMCLATEDCPLHARSFAQPEEPQLLFQNVGELGVLSGKTRACSQVIA